MLSVGCIMGALMQDLVGYVLTFLAGLGTGVVIKIQYDSSRRNKNVVTGDSQGTVNQTRNKVGGNMAGRDVHGSKD